MESLHLDEDLDRQQMRQSLRQMAMQLAKAKDKQATLAQAAHDGALAAASALGRAPKVKIPRRRGKAGRPEHGLWHLTDWQGSKLTTSYDSDVMVQRVMRFVDIAHKITEIQRADHPVDHLTIALGGDMIEGLFNFPTQPYEIDKPLFDQFVFVAQLIERVVSAAAAEYVSVHVVGEWGNHGRLGSKRDAVPKSDNADRMTYKLAAALTKDLANVTWSDSAEDIQRLEIGNYKALLIHGDEIGRGGFASPMTIVNHVNRWRSGAYNWPFRDVYVGHYHNHAEWSMANGVGAVYQTGSTESDNRYARDGMAAAALPSQRLHFIDPRAGAVTSQHKIYLASPDEIGLERE